MLVEDIHASYFQDTSITSHGMMSS